MTSLGAVIQYSKRNYSFEYAQQGYFKDGIRWINTQRENNVAF